ncbi:MAG: hypothetical protein JO125_06505, partial [Chloroflexi bacterium]|nr:hypothetical protein [Chloroflexota bacterium]
MVAHVEKKLKMEKFTCFKPVEGLPYTRTEYTLLSLPDVREHFVQAAAEFFIQSWMSSALPEMRDLWQAWEDASQEDKLDYRLHFDHLFSRGVLIDNPMKGEGYTGPMATFSETMLRWLRQNCGSTQLLLEPPAPLPPEDGKIDLIEITGILDDYASMKLTMWEVKSSESQASDHNSKIYCQLRDYPSRFYRMANSLATRYKDARNPDFQLFLRNMSGMVRRRQPQIHYGVFITYDTQVVQKKTLVPSLHKHPKDHPVSGER